METTSENIRQLLEMLDNPEAYTEQKIQEIINRDEDTRETYRLMVKAKRNSRQRLADQPIDLDAAWQRFNEIHHSKRQGFSWMNIAASFIGVLLVSGIAFAAIWSLTPSPSPKDEGSENILVLDTAKKVTIPLSTGRGVGGEAYIYDNIPLEKMLPEIATHYDAKVTFVNDEARQLRFRFVWNPQKGIDQVVSDLNQFERLTVTLNDNQITVK